MTSVWTYKSLVLDFNTKTLRGNGYFEEVPVLEFYRAFQDAQDDAVCYGDDLLDVTAALFMIRQADVETPQGTYVVVELVNGWTLHPSAAAVLILGKVYAEEDKVWDSGLEAKEGSLRPS